MTKLPQINLNLPFTLKQLPNGGWTLEQASGNPPFAAPGQTVETTKILGAYSNPSDLLAVLQQVMNPPEPQKELVTEVPPFEPSNHPDEWMPMSYAPRTGVYVRIEDEEGSRHRPMKFTAPYWWDAPNGELRLADVNAGHEGVTRAVKWRPLSPEEDKRYNSVKPVVSAPLPAAFR
jgi:hypothetical protein